MARPRVFISSTFYDLRHVRADLEAFIREIGYDPVANERGDIPYGSESSLEEYCYKEIENCDILVSVVGGRFGTESSKDRQSISQLEVQNAITLNRQIYMFVDADVYSELRTYKLNASSKDTRYAHVDDVRVFQFLENVERLKRNNSIFPFRESSHIVSILREQWAGLFQRMLRSASRQEEVRVIDSLKSTAQSLDELVKYIASQAQKGDEKVAEILLPTHPIFHALAEKLEVQYRVYFQNLEEMKRWLSNRGFVEDPFAIDDEWLHFSKTEKIKGKKQASFEKELRIWADLFSGSGDLKVLARSNWNEDWVTVAVPESLDFDDEIPF